MHDANPDKIVTGIWLLAKDGPRYRAAVQKRLVRGVIDEAIIRDAIAELKNLLSLSSTSA